MSNFKIQGGPKATLVSPLPTPMFTQYKPTRLTVISSHCLANDVWGQHSHAEKRINRNLKWIFEDLLPSYCYATNRNSRTVRWQVSQRESAGEGVEMSRGAHSRPHISMMVIKANSLNNAATKYLARCQISR